MLLLDDGFPEFSSKATSTLQDLISEDLTVMLTTSHKSNYSIAEWKNIFKTRDINIKNIKSLPENSNNLSRKDEIVNWFNNNIVEEDFVIIDDDKSLNDLPPFLKAHFVQTSPFVGLTREHFEMINTILYKGLQSL